MNLGSERSFEGRSESGSSRRVNRRIFKGYLKDRMVESPEDTAELERTWESIRDYALSGPQSLELITRMVETWT